MDMLQSFRWVYHHVPTMAAHVAETMSSDVGVIGPDEATREAGALAVLRTMTAKSRSAWSVLAEHCVQHPDAAAMGLSRTDWLSACTERMVVSNAKDFRAYLQEFEVHSLVRSKRSGGLKYYSPPFELPAVLRLLKSIQPA